jgi:uncharacterized protein YkwD
MTPEPDKRLDGLLERWGDLRKRGEDAAAEELCRGCPELIEKLRRRITALKATEWLEHPVQDGGTDTLAGGRAARTPKACHMPPSLGRYRLEELVGVGGFGQVWRAFDPQLCRPVAVKVVRPERVGTPDQTEKLLAEGQRMAQLRHHGIVPVYDVGLDGGRCYIVSEFIEGGSLAERIVAARLGPDDAARLIADVADALHHAHERHIVHRDIKPSNILLDGGGKPFVTDFGIALKTDEQQTVERTTGTIAYMPPEQVTGGPVDARTDIYSLGIVLYQLLTGRVPTDPNLGTASQFCPPIPPRIIDPSIPPRLEKICLKAMARDREGRYPTAQSLAVDLRKITLQRRRDRFVMSLMIGLLIAGICVRGWWTNHARTRAISHAARSPAVESATAPHPSAIQEQTDGISPLAAVELTQDAKALVEQINAARQRQGLRPLTYNTKLAAAAQFHADWLADGGVAGHLEGDKPKSLEQWRAISWHPLNRMIHAGYLESGILNSPDASEHCGELIAYRSKNLDAKAASPENVGDDWNNDKSDRLTAMGRYLNVGIGTASTKQGVWWVAVFGNP